MTEWALAVCALGPQGHFVQPTFSRRGAGDAAPGGPHTRVILGAALGGGADASSGSGSRCS